MWKLANRIEAKESGMGFLTALVIAAIAIFIAYTVVRVLRDKQTPRDREIMRDPDSRPDSTSVY